MQEYGRPEFDVLRSFGEAVDKSLGQLSEAGKRKAEFASAAVVGRALTHSELQMIQWMFGTVAGISQARIVARNYWWPLPLDRVMAPHGDIFFLGEQFFPDFSLPHVPIRSRALFMHEATHLFQ